MIGLRIGTPSYSEQHVHGAFCWQICWVFSFASFPTEHFFLPFYVPGGWPLKTAPQKLPCLLVFHLVWLIEALLGAKSIYHSPASTPLLLATILPAALFFQGTDPLFLSDSPLYRSGNFISSSCPCGTGRSDGCLV